LTYFINFIKLKAKLETILHYINKLKSISIFYKMCKKKNELKIKQQQNQNKHEVAKRVDVFRLYSVALAKEYKKIII